MADETMTVEERATRQDEIRTRLTEIDTEFSGGTLPEDVEREWDELSDEMDEHSRAIEAAERRSERLRELADNGARERGSDTGRRSPAFVRKTENIYDLNAVRNTARSMDEVASMYRDNAMRAVEQHRFPGVASREDAQGQVEHLLSNVDDKAGTLARRILATGSPAYERAFGKAVLAGNTNGLNSEERAALAMAAGSSGAYAVPFQLDPSIILTSDGQIDPLRSMSRVAQITGKTWQGVTSAGVTVTRSGEAVEVEDNVFTLAQPEVNTSRATGFVPFSMEAELEWSSMRSEITMVLADAKAREEAVSFLTGTGAAVTGGGTNPEGVVYGVAAHSGDTPSTVLTVGSVAGSDFSAFNSDAIYGLEDELAPRWRAKGQFLANRSIYNKIRGLAATDGSDLWVRLASPNPNELIGYPAREASKMDSSLDTDGNNLVLFGDFSQFLIVDRLGMQVELVPHLFGNGSSGGGGHVGYPTGQRGVLAVWMNGSKVLVPNAFRLLQANTA